MEIRLINGNWSKNLKTEIKIIHALAIVLRGARITSCGFTHIYLNNLISPEIFLNMS